MATYYVDFTAGGDSNNGTAQGTAWKHCHGDPNATGNAASTTIHAGDVIYFKGGIVYTGGVVIQAAGQVYDNGVAGNLIYFYSGDIVGWGSGRAIVDGGATTAGNGPISKGFYIFGRSYIHIEGFEIRNMANASNSSGIMIEGATGSYCEFVGNLIHEIYGQVGASGYGIEITADVSAAYHLVEHNEIYHTEEKACELYRQGNCTVRFNYFHDTNDHCMVTSSQYNDIHNNIFANAGTHWMTYENPFRAAYGFKFDSGTAGSPAASNNNFYNNLLWGCSSGIGILNGSYNNIFQNTVVYTGYQGGEGGGQEGASLAILDDGTTGSPPYLPTGNVIENNIFYYAHPIISGNSVAIIYNTIGNNNVVKNNLIYYDGTITKYTDCNVSGHVYYTIASFEGSGTGAFSAIGSGNVASGNIVAPPALAGGTGATLNGVCPQGFDTSTWLPLNANMAPLVGSAAIDAGLTLPSSPFGVDISGTTRPQGSGWDIGAYEFWVGSGTVSLLVGRLTGVGVIDAPVIAAVNPGNSTVLADFLSMAAVQDAVAITQQGAVVLPYYISVSVRF
jgi:hypothetical protein